MLTVPLAHATLVANEHPSFQKIINGKCLSQHCRPHKNNYLHEFTLNMAFQGELGMNGLGRKKKIVPVEFPMQFIIHPKLEPLIPILH